MDSNCSLHRLPPLDPAVDPAYVDGEPPRRHTATAAGILDVEWFIGRMPEELSHAARVSFERLEDAIERDARREER